MKLRLNLFFLFAALVFIQCFLAAGEIAAQSPTKTIVLVRHAERDGTMANNPDPELSPEGRARAIRLVNAIKKYKPHEIFSTNYKRTRLTAEPTANSRKKQIQTYDPAKQSELVDKIMASKTDHYLIVGHSNTIPALANLLAKKEIFRNLLETEYGVFWVIRMKNGVLQRIEMFPF
jgi:2,3-bisphosphoglycerate-dependent phosphoglycerate mutase